MKIDGSKKENILKLARKFLPIVTYSTSLLSVSSIYLGGYITPLDIFSHFQLQYFVVLLLLIPVLVLIKSYKSVIITLLYSLFLISFITPVQLIQHSQESFPDELYFINSWIFNGEVHEVIDDIEEIKPQKVAVVEASADMILGLEEIYGEPVALHKDKAFTCVIFSHERPLDSGVIRDSEYPICTATFIEYTLYVIHPYPPFTLRQRAAQDRYFSYISDLIEAEKAKGRTFLLVGDFNSTNYSTTFRKYFAPYFKKSIYSWRSNLPVALPIDHALSNADLVVNKSKKLTSDHNALYIEFAPNRAF